LKFLALLLIFLRTGPSLSLLLFFSIGILRLLRRCKVDKMVPTRRVADRTQ
jgi:hypothetical protein